MHTEISHTKFSITKITPVWSRLMLVILISIGPSVSSYAHHSFAMFDATKSTALKGVVRKVEWRNPHVFFFIEVPGKNGAQLYAIECGSINYLVRVGWKVNSVKVGDTVTVAMHPLRDGKSGGSLQSMALANGTTLEG